MDGQLQLHLAGLALSAFAGVWYIDHDLVISAVTSQRDKMSSSLTSCNEAICL